MPGRTVRPERSTTLTFPEACRLTRKEGPISTIFSPSIRMAWSLSSVPVRMSISLVVLIRTSSFVAARADARWMLATSTKASTALRIMVPPECEASGAERVWRPRANAGLRDRFPAFQRAPTCLHGAPAIVPATQPAPISARTRSPRLQQAISGVNVNPPSHPLASRDCILRGAGRRDRKGGSHRELSNSVAIVQRALSLRELAQGYRPRPDQIDEPLRAVDPGLPDLAHCGRRTAHPGYLADRPR